MTLPERGVFFGAGDRDRTGTDFTPRDFKSLVSAYSTTPAKDMNYAPHKRKGRNGDPDENRTRVTAVKGRCLNRLTTGPYMRGLKPFYENTSVGRCVELVAAVGFEPTTNRV